MSLIGQFLTGTYTVERQRPGFYKNGEFQAGKAESVTVRGSLQPLGMREIKMLPEGDRVKDLLKFYSDTALTIIDPRLSRGADRVIIDGERYKVISTEKWAGPAVGLPHFKSILSREPQQ